MKILVASLLAVVCSISAWAQKEMPDKVICFMTGIKGVKIVSHFINKRTALDINDRKGAAAIVIHSCCNLHWLYGTGSSYREQNFS